MEPIKNLLEKIIELKGSDLFITVGIPVCMKVDGTVKNLNEHSLTSEEAKEIILSLMEPAQKEELLNRKECNFALQIESGRFRVNAFYQRGNVGAVLRRIETIIPGLEDLQVPPILSEFIMAQRGLIILVGATGSGKSSTLAAMVGYRNKNSTGHIITIEDPIEFIHPHAKSIITQREVGVDTESFELALKNTLRQAPDVILIGEIRSQDTMNYAINFAETGHLCLATLHANNANQALDRIVNFFPHEKRQQLLADLSLNLRAIIAQQLIPLVGGKGRIPAVEILINTPAVSESIKKGDISGIKEYISKGNTIGMQTFDQALFMLYKDNKISYEEALQHADSENELRLMIKLSTGQQNNLSSDFKDVKLK
ncbi:MAG: PilT/PilU family type 4a pilus ATPase [Gammaproteobacteria bacterium]|jgi:twitching motility protein PilU